MFMLLRGDPAERSDTGLHQLREAHMLSLGEENAPPEGPTKRMSTFVESPREPAEIREFADSGRKLNIRRQSDFGFACDSSGPKCWGLFCGLNQIPRNAQF